MKPVLIIKNKLDAVNPKTVKEIYDNAKESFNSNVTKFYIPRENDENSLKEYFSKDNNNEYFIAMIFYKKNGKIDTNNINNTEIESIYLGTASLRIEKYVLDGKEKETLNIEYIILKIVEGKKVIVNLLDPIGLDLKDDYMNISYVIINSMKDFIVSIYDLLQKSKKISIRSDYEEIPDDKMLKEYAQKNKFCKRMYGSQTISEYRNEFQRDRERIVNCKSFRRLVDKAQIFSAEKGDHYRTRMTHTLEVTQIAKSISKSLGLNLDLTEAIALAHDLGHTPFGHQGERTIRDILSGEEKPNIFNIDDKIFTSELFGGFKHNLQGLRVLTKLEEKYIEHNGLDISLQVLEGVLKHTKIKDGNINQFIDISVVPELHIDRKYASSLEGQVVAIADEIAQRGHDIDDAITSGLIAINDLLESLSTYKFKRLFNILDKCINDIDENNRTYIDKNNLIISRIVSSIVDYLIKDVIDKSKELIADNFDYSNILFKEEGIVETKMIDFSLEDGNRCCEFLERVVNKRVINNSEVAKFDQNANTIIKKLFITYYNNPKLLINSTLRKVYIDTLNADSTEISNTAIDLLNGNIDIVRKEIDEITKGKISDLSNPKEMIILEKRKILVRNIVDYIAGMTDSYAINEYRNIK